MQYTRLASAEFVIGTSDQRITVKNVPFAWTPPGNMDQQATFAAASYIGEHNLTNGKPVTLVWVSSSQATQ